MAASDVLIRNDTAVTVTITLASLATITTGNARQSAVIDFGATRADRWLCRLQATPGGAPTAGAPLEVYMGFASATASANFPGGLAAADTGYTGYADASIVNAKQQLSFVGVLPCTASAVLQTADIGTVTPKLRYAQVVVVNNCLASLSGAGTHGITFTPIVDQVGT